MTVANQTNSTSVVGTNAVGQEIAFLFPITNTSDLVVKTRVRATGAEIILSESTNYIVAISGDVGGTVTMVTAVAATSEIHLIRQTPKTQELDLEAGGPFDAELNEDALDKNTKIGIDNSRRIDRTLRLPDTDSSTVVLPSVGDRKGKFMFFDRDNGVPTAAAGVTPDDVTVSVYGETLVDDVDAAAARATLNIIDGATYTIYRLPTIGVDPTYYAQPSSELDSDNYPPFENTDLADLLDDVMETVRAKWAVIPAVSNANWVPGHKIIMRDGIYAFTRTWTTKPVQEFMLDFSRAQIFSAVTTTDAIRIDSCMNSYFRFGLINVATTGKTVRIYPQTNGPDGLITVGGSIFEFTAVLNVGETALTLDATATGNTGISFCTFKVAELAAALCVELLNTSGPPAAIDANFFEFVAASCTSALQVGQAAGSADNIHRNHFQVIGSPSGTGVEIYGLRNTFNVVLFGHASGAAENVVFGAGALNNTVSGYAEDGWTDNSGSTTNQVFLNGSGVGAIGTRLGGTLRVQGASTLIGALGLTGAATLASTLGVTGATTLLSTLGVTGAATFTAGSQNAAVALTASAGGAGITPGTSHVTITSGNAIHIIVLPTNIIGNRITLVTPATGCELRTAVSGQKINTADCGAASNELELAADSHFDCVCISATEWTVSGFDNVGADIGALTPHGV